MNIVQTLPLAGRALARNKLRSFLTMLGVIIGVASVISMVAVGEGAKRQVEAAFASMGTNVLVVVSGSTRGGGVQGGLGSMPTLTWGDLDAIRSHATEVAAAAPQLGARLPIVAEEVNWTTMVYGTSSEYFPIRGWTVARGSLLSHSDVDTGGKVIVLGETVSEKLFGAGVDPLGRVVRIHSVPLTVVGVLQRKGQSAMGQDMDDVVMVPYTTFQAKIQGSLGQFIPGSVLVSAKSDTRRAQAQIEAILRDRHDIQARNEDDFFVRNLTQAAQARAQGTEALTGLLAAIAIVSLLVGGIGIMNIMLVSVTERTREIGLRMAVGAKPWHVLAQFLVEAMTLSMTGGLIGLVLGIGVGRLVATNLGYAYEPRPDMAILAFAFSAFVGVVFGFYPARRAARLDPIEALRSD